MTDRDFPAPILEAVTVKTAGATGVARLAIDGLLELAADRAALAEAAAFLRDSLPGYAPIWHIVHAASTASPADELRRIRSELDHGVARTVQAAVGWLAARPGPVVTAPSSSIVAQVLAVMGARDDGDGPPVGLAGADAISPTTFLNILGTRELTSRVPTVVVSTSLKLVPEEVFATLGAPTFEPIPLDEVAAVILDGVVYEPREVGRCLSARQPSPGDPVSA